MRASQHYGNIRKFLKLLRYVNRVHYHTLSACMRKMAKQFWETIDEAVSGLNFSSSCKVLNSFRQRLHHHQPPAAIGWHACLSICTCTDESPLLKSLYTRDFRIIAESLSAHCDFSRSPSSSPGSPLSFESIDELEPLHLPPNALHLTPCTFV